MYIIGLIDKNIYSGNIFAGITDHLANYAIGPTRTNMKSDKTSDRQRIRIFSDKIF